MGGDGCGYLERPVDMGFMQVTRLAAIDKIGRLHLPPVCPI